MIRTRIWPTIALSVLVGGLYFGVTSGNAQTYGDAQWCAVTSPTDGTIKWDCEYRSVEECRPHVLAGDRGFCNVNPYWTGSYRPASRDRTRPKPHLG